MSSTKNTPSSSHSGKQRNLAQELEEDDFELSRAEYNALIEQVKDLKERLRVTQQASN